jgi:hypothetical protein
MVKEEGVTVAFEVSGAEDERDEELWRRCLIHSDVWHMSQMLWCSFVAPIREEARHLEGKEKVNHVSKAQVNRKRESEGRIEKSLSP